MAEKIQNQQEFEEKVLKSEKLVLVDFFAEWCPPCKAMLPIIERLSETHADKIKIVKVNIDETPAIAEEYGAPTETIVGAMPEDEILKRIK